MSINASGNNGCAPNGGIALTPTFHERSVALRKKKSPSIARPAVFFSLGGLVTQIAAARQVMAARK
jgi:hypothetical protein